LGTESKFQGIQVKNDTNFLVSKLITDHSRGAAEFRQWEFKQIVSYSNNILIIDQLGYGNYIQPVIFRTVYMKMDRIGK
jgi:hypothetical protein